MADLSHFIFSLCIDFRTLNNIPIDVQFNPRRFFALFFWGGGKTFFSEKKGGWNFFSLLKRGQGFFLKKKRGARCFFRSEKGGHGVFLWPKIPKTRPGYPINFARSLMFSFWAFHGLV